MTKRRRQYLVNSLRVLVCVIFVAVAVRGLTFHDKVVLKDDAGEKTVRLVSESQDTLTVLDGNEEFEVQYDRLALDTEGNPRIERGLSTAFRRSSPRHLLLAILLFAPVPLLQSFRFQLMLRAQEIRLTFWEAIKISVGGNFLNFVFMIGSTAGDVFKAYSTALHTERKTEAVTTILLDRIVGLSGLLVVAGIMSFTGSDDPTLAQLGIFSLAVLGGFLVFAVLMTSRRVRSIAPHGLISRLPGIEYVKRIYGATERIIRHRPTLVICLLLAVALQFLAVGAGVVCALALHMDFTGAKVWDYFAYIGCGHVVAAIPIAPLGLGTMELAYKHFFLGDYGTLPQLLCLALWVRLLQLVWSLPGAFFTLLGQYRPKQCESPMEAATPTE